MKKILTLFGLVALLAAASSAWAAGFFYVPAAHDNPDVAQVSFDSGDFCLAMSMQICGDLYTAPGGGLGATVTFNLPEKFVTNTATLECTRDGGLPYYKLMNSDVSACAVKTCKPGSFKVCNASVPVAATTDADDVVNISLPADIAANPFDPSPVVVAARCDIVNGITRYDAVDAAHISCNSFLCQPTRLQACNSMVDVGDPGPLGSVIHMTAENNQPVTVQCVGTMGLAPQYQVTDCN